MTRAAAFALAVLLSQNLPQPPPDMRPAVIVGQAIDATNGRAVRRAIVRLQGTSAAVTRVADERGRFFFVNLPPASYTITASRDGYFDGAFGRVHAGGDGLVLPLQPGEWRTGVEIRLFRPAVISGSVDDEALEPLAGIRVQAFRRAWIDGRESWTPAESTETDDKGDYRLHGLMPGEYVVAVPSVQVTMPIATIEQVAQSGSAARDTMAVLYMNGGPGSLMGGSTGTMSGILIDPDGRNTRVLGTTATPPLADTAPQLAYQTLFYPAADDPETAVTIRVAPGQARDGVNFRLATVATARVSGELEGPDGPVAGLMLRLLRDGTSDFGLGAETAVTLSAPDGSFTFLHVPAGRYVISARSAESAIPNWQPPGIAVPASVQLRAVTLAGRDELWGEQPVTVFDQDVTDVVVSAARGATITGHVVFETQGEQPPPDMTATGLVTLERATSGLGNVPPAPVTNEGDFTIAGVPPGRYRLGTAGLPEGWYLKSVAANGLNAAAEPIDIMEGDEIADIVVTLTDRPAGLTGSVYDGRGLAVPGARVIVVPAGRAAGIDRGASARDIRSVRADVYGIYSLTGVTPGAYDLLAVAEEAGVRWQDPAALARLGGQAIRVTIQEGQAVQQALRVAAPRRD